MSANRDPASSIGKALKPVPRKRKRPALLSLDDLHEMLRKTEWEKGSALTKLASRFLALTAQRPGTVRAMPWAELENVSWDSDDECPEAIWRIPAARMKLSNELKQDQEFEHLVPLCRQAVAVLRVAHRISGRGPLVFPGNRSGWRPMSENTLSYFYNRCGYARHGRPAHDDVSGADRAARAAKQVHERIAGLDCARSRAGLIVAAGSIHLARRNPGDADVRALAAPDRAIAIVNVGRGAGEGLTGADDSSGEGKQAHRP